MQPSNKKYSPRKILENVEVVDVAVKGKSIARIGEVVVLLDGGVPGDVVDVKIKRKRKNYWEGYPIAFRRYSPYRAQPFCDHYGACGGCKWQEVAYEHQLRFKQKMVTDNLHRVAGLENVTVPAVVPSPQPRRYRNKMEFSFTSRRWLSPEEVASGEPIADRRGLGLHFAGRFDWIVHIHRCHLASPDQDTIRNHIFEKAVAYQIPFYEPIKGKGGLRSLVLRSNLEGEWLVLLVGSEAPDAALHRLLDDAARLEGVRSVYYGQNQQRNDALTNVTLHHWAGDRLLPQPMKHRRYYVGPLSFFQPNTQQAVNLYETVRRFVPENTRTLLDAYCGIGAIGLWVADRTDKVVGIETVPEAVEMARYNAEQNGIDHAAFYHLSADEVDQVADTFDVVVVDPPRAGLSKKMVDFLRRNQPARIIYVSCNPATQARDVGLLKDRYHMVFIQPFDMFPHTPHVENIIVLDRI